MRAVAACLGVLIVLGACSQPAPSSTSSGAPVATEAPTPSGEGHFNPTEAVGGGANSSSTIADVSSIFASVPQVNQLRLTVNASPPNASGADVTAVSVVGQDPAGLLKSLDSAAKQTLGDAMLTAAATAWPNATISLLISDASGGSSQIIGNRPQGGPNTIIAT
jgi:hypothetical protein